MRKLLLLALMSVAMFSGAACGFVIPSPSPEPEDVHAPRVIPSDPKLPKYDNPAEIDLEDGNLHISFKGVFRQFEKDNKPNKYVVFCFVAVPKKDIVIDIDESELFDGKARRYARRVCTPAIGAEFTWRREIIEGIPIQIQIGYEMPEPVAGVLPSIARVNFTFNGQIYQFRNLKTEEWQVWKELAQELGIYY